MQEDAQPHELTPKPKQKLTSTLSMSQRVPRFFFPSSNYGTFARHIPLDTMQPFPLP